MGSTLRQQLQRLGPAADSEELLNQIISLQKEGPSESQYPASDDAGNRLSSESNIIETPGIHAKDVCREGHQRTANFAHSNQQRRKRRTRQIKPRQRKPSRSCREGCCCKACANILRSQYTPRLNVRGSTIKGAGKGLFAAEDIRGGTCLGELKGKAKICTSNTKEERDDQKVTGFKVSKNRYIDSSPEASKLFFVNHQNARIDQNATSRLCGGRPFFFALQDIRREEEIFASYGGHREFPNTPNKSLERSMYRTRSINGLFYRGLIIINVDQYIYVKGANIKAHSRKSQVWVAKVRRIFIKENKEYLWVTWMHNLDELPRDAQSTSCGPSEIFNSTPPHEDEIDVETVMDHAYVREGVGANDRADDGRHYLYTWRTWDWKQGQFVNTET